MCVRWLCASVAACFAAGLAGCGTPAAPQPPSLKLPAPVTNLAAERTGNSVQLTWTMPTRTTDKLPIQGNVAVHICRKEASGPCVAASPDQPIAPGAERTFTEPLPSPLISGQPRLLQYFVELKNKNGRSAGLSNAAFVVAGEAPGPITDLSATLRKDGVVLRWAPDGERVPVRLHRKLLTSQPQPKQQGLLAAPPEPVEMNLLIDQDTLAAVALDKSVRFGATYEYRAQRVARLTVAGHVLELAGALSLPADIAVLDVFPPVVPKGLAAVAIAAQNGTPAAIDLSWQPNTEGDLAGYIVYRREDDGVWRRISPAEPLIGPAFHDADVEPGHIYHYAVSAIDQGGHESAHSAEAQESVPADRN
jgi:hypothetical protein